ncbi:universal stress protein [Sinimarinibacterium flocculans]|uniref:Universal stress protein n=1 Tax=Sinimarinibacterium flocculans TaxID=985250 RepID=A0A318EHG4_9GAMM|nr:universal stress protein [Sinimarinibacterium flocculans]PXV70229.1 universal stress protein A [Sinimarinibacterium flocculans]
MTYQHLLAAIAIDEHGEGVAQRAKALAAQFGARLSIVHVVEYIPLETGEALMAAPPDLAAQLQEQARTRLHELSVRLGLESAQLRVASGGVAAEIHRAAKELGADLIIVGHHPRHGLSALFSHTEEDVVQRARCDVLAVCLTRD